MSRVIRIETCELCPHRGHKGGFGKVAYIPKCDLTGDVLPYKAHASVTNNMYAQPTYIIPETCTLERLP